MEILINGVKADIVPDTEKTIGQVLAGIESWLAGDVSRSRGGLRMSGMEIDGAPIGADSLERAFSREIASIKTLNVIVKSLTELLSAAMLETRHCLSEYESLDFAQKQGYGNLWEAMPAASLIKEHSMALYGEIIKTFSGEGLNVPALSALIDERLREIENPSAELSRIGMLVTEVSGRMEELPLDIQTGKDRRASETVQLFSGLAEKIFRIYYLLEMHGLMPNDIKIDEFNAVLKEMLAAYKNNDSVLVGDMAEYELAPRLRELYTTLTASNGAST
jgi:hypothetical protein